MVNIPGSHNDWPIANRIVTSSSDPERGGLWAACCARGLAHSPTSPAYLQADGVLVPDYQTTSQQNIMAANGKDGKGPPTMADARINLTLDLPAVSTRLRKLSQAFFNAQQGEKVDLMNDWEIGGTQNKWVCPSDRHLQLRAQLKSGWSVRTATARSPTNSKEKTVITDAEQEHIRQVLAKLEESRQRENVRVGKLVDRVDKMKRQAVGNGITHCLICTTEFGLLHAKSYAAMCSDCRKYVCQRNCGVETQDPSNPSQNIFLCKICSEQRELWKKSGAWFYKTIPEIALTDQMGNGSVPVGSPQIARPSWANGTANSTPPEKPKRHLPMIPQEQRDLSPHISPRSSPSRPFSLPTAPLELPITLRAKSPRPRIQPKWVTEKVMSSMSVDDDEKSSSDGEYGDSTSTRKPHRQPSTTRREANLARFALHSQRITDSEEESSPESHASTRSTSPRRSLATPSSYDSSHNNLKQSDVNPPEDARSIDSGGFPVVQSDHSNPQAALNLSASSLAPLNQIPAETTPSRSSLTEPAGVRITQSGSGMSLVTPPLPSSSSRNSPLNFNERQLSMELCRKMSISSAMSSKNAVSTESIQQVAEPKSQSWTSTVVKAESPSASFMSSPEDTKSAVKRRGAVLERIDTSQLSQSVSIQSISDGESTTSAAATTHYENSLDEIPTPKLTNGSLTNESSSEQGAILSPDSVIACDNSEYRAGGRSKWFACFFPTRIPTTLGTLGSIQFSLTYHQKTMKLEVHLIRAKNLKAMDSNGFSDPYVKLHLLPGNNKATKLTSKTIPKTLNPEWNEMLCYHGLTEEDKLMKTLRVTVLDRDRVGSDFLGETRIALKKLPVDQTKKFNLYLEHALPVQQSQTQDDKDRGKIFVALQYNVQQGSLFVNIKRCAELIGMDNSGFSDPYCKVTLIPTTSKSHRLKTSIKKRTLNPEFNETLQFVVPFKDLPQKSLKIGVYDHDIGKQDDYIGGILLSLSANNERGKQWLECIKNPGQWIEVWHKLELDT